MINDDGGTLSTSDVVLRLEDAQVTNDQFNVINPSNQHAVSVDSIFAYQSTISTDTASDPGTSCDPVTGDVTVAVGETAICLVIYGFRNIKDTSQTMACGYA